MESICHPSKVLTEYERSRNTDTKAQFRTLEMTINMDPNFERKIISQLK